MFKQSLIPNIAMTFLNIRHCFLQSATGSRQRIFPGESSVDQLVEIIKVLGTPTREEIEAMNKNYTDFKFPSIKAHPWSKIPMP